MTKQGNGMTEIGLFLQSIQLGTVSGWTLVAAVLLFWWKGLPGIIEAWEKRSNGVEARLNASMAAYVARTESKLAEADKLHQQCRDENIRLHERIGSQDITIATLNETLVKQTALIVDMGHQIAGLKASNLQQQIAVIEDKGPSPAIATMIHHLKEIK